MRNVDPTGRTPRCRASPFRTAPIPCSRTPKWMLRAPQLPTATSPPFLNTTFVEPARSAEPPISSGNFAATAFSTLPDAARVAWASVGAKAGRSASHASGNRPAGRGGERGVERAQVVAIGDPLDVPAVALEAARGVVRERQIGLAVDGDAVVVVDPDQLAQLEVARQRAGLVRDTFHHVAI